MFTELIIAAVILAALSLIMTVRAVARWRWLLNRKTVTLEMTPPAFKGRVPEATQKLFTVLHGLRSSRTVSDRLLGREPILTLEIDSTRQTGIRYLLSVDEKLVETVYQTVSSYLPDAKISQVAVDPPSGATVVSYKQTGHYAFPLNAHDSLDHHDPAAYIAGAMTKLNDSENIRFQLVLKPVKLRQAAALSHKILVNEDLLTELSHRKIPFWSELLHLINVVLFGLVDMVSAIYHTPGKNDYSASARDAHERQQIAKRLKPARQISTFEQELIASIHHKVSQPLFSVSIRAAVTAEPDITRQRLSALRSALESLSVPSYQSLHAARRYPFSGRLKQLALSHKLPAVTGGNILSASEVADIFHFPLGLNSRTDNLITSLSRTLPAPVSLKQSAGLDVVVGVNEHHGTTTPIGLTEAERERHIYIIGGTGNGKTTMLLYGIVQDIKNGKGVAVLDPHGDLAESVLKYIPEERIKDVIYMNPDDLTHPIGMNLLELTPGLTGDDLLREKDLITESTISVLRKIFSDDDTGGHRIEYVLRNTIQTALTLEGANLFTIFRLLNDSKYRRVIVKGLQDQDLKNFWDNELGKAGEFQRVKMAAGITAKVGRFLFSASAKRILEQEKSTIDFSDILDSGKILICNFSKGLLGEDTSTLFGTTVLAKLQVAALRRARQQQSSRRPFYLYVDEFQNFATMSFVQMLSEARKYKLFLTMAEQSTAQQDHQRLVDIILANVGTVVCFRSGSPADERLVLPLFSPFIEQGEIANLPAYSFYARIAAVNAQEPMSGKTLLMDSPGSEVIAEQVIKSSRKIYSTTARPDEPFKRPSKQESGRKRRVEIKQARAKTDRAQVTTPMI